MSRIFLLISLSVLAVNARIAHFHLDGRNPLTNDVVDSSVWHRLYGLGKHVDEEPAEPSVCTTDQCELMAGVMKASMNESVDPCVDFYRYACGGWPESGFADSQQMYSLWGIVGAQVDNNTAEIVGREPSPDDPKPMKMAREIYDTCMDTEAREEEGMEPFLTVVTNAGGWPMIMKADEWNAEESSWQKADDYYSRLIGSNALFTIGVGFDEVGITTEIKFPVMPHDACELFANEEDSKCPKVSDEEDDRFTHVKKFMKRAKRESKRSKKYATKSSKKRRHRKARKHEARHEARHVAKEVEEVDSNDLVRENYERFVTEVALAFAQASGNDVAPETIKKDAEEMVDFMVLLVRMMDKPSLTPTNLTIAELQEVYDGQKPEGPNANINWFEKISTAFKEAGIEVDQELKISFKAENYIINLVHLLNKTPGRVVANYVHWAFVSNRLFASVKRMRDWYYAWQSGGEESEDDAAGSMALRCDEVVDKNEIIGYMYVKTYFSDDARKAASSMIDHIEEAVKRETEQSKWMDEWTKQFVLDKLKDMKKIVGYPEWYNNKTAVEHYFDGLTVSKSFFENAISYRRFLATKDLQTLEHMDPDSLANPLTLNAFYAAQFNALAVTAADLQSPLFGARRPATLNYGIIGAVLGHEVNHGFDDNGRMYDHKGKLTHWLAAMAAEYGKRAECFVDQYENYANQLKPTGEFKGYGNQTKNENIADTMGVEACYSALKALEAEKGKPEDTLPGFEKFTSDQIFFLSYANLWCESERMSMLPGSAHRDVHSTPGLRVWGAVSNTRAFGQAFNCAPGTPMNPQRKCNIWQ